jgi:glutathione synthase/RimK-type ligase-like ATP-grasp enzyme
MNKNNLTIITCRDKFFGQTRKPWTSLNMDKIIVYLQKDGYTVELLEFHDIINKNLKVENKTVIYAFSQKDNYRAYINDIIYHLSKNNRVIPSYDLLKCHENKGYQEIYKKEIGLKGLPASYYTSFKEVDFFAISYPVVLKTTQGTNGKGVYLIKNRSDFQKTIKRLVARTSIWTHIDLLRRKYLRRKKFKEYPDYSNKADYHEYKEYLRQEENFIIQKFIPDLDFDYRVLVGFNRYYVMRRSVRSGDFRASGSKKFSFSYVPDHSLLDFAQSVYDKFDTPFLSLDVLYDGKTYYLGEFQALHFGMSVVARSMGYFGKLESGWEFIEEKPDVNRFFAKTITGYLQSGV